MKEVKDFSNLSLTGLCSRCIRKLEIRYKAA